MAPRPGARRRATCCCSASACRPPTRAAPATGTCCSRCSAFVVYYNLINLSQAWVASGKRRHGRGAARRCTAARSCSRSRCCGGASTAPSLACWPPRARARGERHEDGAPPALWRHRRRRCPSSRWRSCRCSSSSTSSTSSTTSASSGYTAWHAALYSACCELPGHFYELLPIAVLIGTIYALARLAQSSRVHDPAHRRPRAGPRAVAAGDARAWRSRVVTFVVGDYLAPLSERAGVRLQAQLHGRHRSSAAPAPG